MIIINCLFVYFLILISNKKLILTMYINNNQENINKYNNYLTFLKFRKSLILKSINEYQINNNINISKLNNKLEKTNKDILKYHNLLQNINK